MKNHTDNDKENPMEADALRLTKEQHLLLQNIASVYLQHAHYDKALPLLLLQIKLFPKDLAVYRQLAYLYYQQLRYDAAVKCCDHVLKLTVNDNTAWPYLIKSFCSLKSGKPKAARAYYEQYIKTSMSNT